MRRGCLGRAAGCVSWVDIQWVLQSVRVCWTYRAEEEQDDGGQSSDSTHYCTPEDASRGGYGGVFGLLSDVAGCVESDQNTCCGEIGQTPVPAWRGAGAVVGRHESFFGGSETPGVVCPNGEPDDV